MVTPRRGIRSHKLPERSSLISSLGTSDVLLGRGSPTIKFEGNIAFRQIVRQRKPEYTATGQHKVKDRIAHEIYAAIQGRGGRFLRRLDSTELSKLDLAVNSKFWAVVEHEVAMEKVKQALRDREPAAKSTEAIHDLRNAQNDAVLLNNTNNTNSTNNIPMWQEALRASNNSPQSVFGLNAPQLPSTSPSTAENQKIILAALLQQESMRQKAMMMNQWMLMKGLMNTGSINNNCQQPILIPGFPLSNPALSMNILNNNKSSSTTTTPLERLFATGHVEGDVGAQNNATSSAANCTN